MSKAHSKGRLFEYAIARIEESLLKNDPSLRGAQGVIEANKILVIEGVRYEVDVLIVVNGGSHLGSRHIIECKNWKTPVGTDEIAKLSIKREKVCATSATLVARRFTRDARLLAKQNKITLLTASEDLVPGNLELSIHSPKLEAGSVTVTFRDQLQIPIKLDYDQTACEFNGHTGALGQFLDRLAVDQIKIHSQNDPRKKLGGVFAARIETTIPFAVGKLRVAGFEVAQITLDLTYSVNVALPIATWRIGVERRGGLIQFEYPKGTLGHENVVIEVLTKSQS